MSLYLLKRGSTYYFRRVIPTDLRPALGRTEFVFSLGTKEVAEAKRLRTSAIAATDKCLLEACLEITSPGPDNFKSFDGPKLIEFHVPATTTVRRKFATERQADFSDWTRLLELWQTDRKAIQKTQDTYLRVARQLFEFCRKPPSSLTKKDITDFKNHLLTIAGKSNANVHEILKKVRSLLGIAVESNMLEYNPAEKVRVTFKRNQRRPFSHEDFVAIFSSAVFLDGLRPTEGRGEAAYWIPILMALHGLRPGEVAQSRTMDVRTHTIFLPDGTQSSWPFIHITKDEKDKLTLKNIPSERFVPIHPVASQLGFIKYVQNLRDKKIYWLFPELTADKYGNKAAKWSEWFIEYMRTVCGITDKLKVLYSFRHAFKDLARDCGMPDPLQRAIMGHAGIGVADTYGSGFGLYRLSEAIKMVRIPALSILGASFDY